MTKLAIQKLDIFNSCYKQEKVVLARKLTLAAGFGEFLSEGRLENN